MKRFALKMVVAMVAGVFFALPIALAATYTQTLLTDGVNVWTLVSASTSASSQMTLQRNGVTVLTFDPVNGIVLQDTVVASLPSCTAGLTGAVRVVSDGNSTTTGGTLAGSGANTVLAVCNGSNWIVN